VHPQTLLLGIKKPSLSLSRFQARRDTSITSNRTPSRLRRCRLLPERHQDKPSAKHRQERIRARTELAISPQEAPSPPSSMFLPAFKVVHQHPLADSDAARQLVETQIDGSRFHERGEASRHATSGGRYGALLFATYAIVLGIAEVVTLRATP